MKQEYKDRWLEGLRSGEFSQTTGQYKTKDGCYCALGVLGQMIVDDGKAEWRKDLRDIDPPELVVIGTHIDPIISVARLDLQDVSDIMAMNDSQKLPFPEIADWIEEHVEVRL